MRVDVETFERFGWTCEVWRCVRDDGSDAGPYPWRFSVGRWVFAGIRNKCECRREAKARARVKAMIIARDHGRPCDVGRECCGPAGLL